MTQKFVQLGYKSLVAWLHQYMALAALVLMYSLGLALWNTLTLGLQMPCTDVTVLQLLRVHICTAFTLRMYVACVFKKESRLLAACRMKNDRISGLSSLLLGNRMETEYICPLLELLEMYS